MSDTRIPIRTRSARCTGAPATSPLPVGSARDVHGHAGTVDPGHRTGDRRRGDVVALVAVGVTVEHLDAATNRRLLVLGAIAAGALLVGIGGAAADLELGPAPDPRHGHTRAGADVHLLRRRARLRARGDAAAGRRRADRQRERGGRRLLGSSTTASSAARRPPPACPTHVAQLIDDQEGLTDELVLTERARARDVSRRPVQRARRHGRRGGHPARPHRDDALTGELDRAQRFSDALRAQAHESANRMHTVISLIELGEADHALNFAVGELATAQSPRRRGARRRRQPGGRRAAARQVRPGGRARDRVRGHAAARTCRPGAAPDHELVTILGNLVDNAFDAVAAGAATGHAGWRSAASRRRSGTAKLQACASS